MIFKQMASIMSISTITQLKYMNVSATGLRASSWTLSGSFAVTPLIAPFLCLPPLVPP